MEHFDILIIGGGAAGIAAAKEAAGAKVLLVDSKNALGGVLLQCTHLGFGKNKSGIQYAADLLLDFPKEITLALNTTVLSVSEDRTALLSGREFGRKTVAFSQLILATGCREIPMGALPIGGTRPKGVYTAGQMQERMNLLRERISNKLSSLEQEVLKLHIAGHNYNSIAEKLSVKFSSSNNTTCINRNHII